MGKSGFLRTLGPFCGGKVLKYALSQIKRQLFLERQSRNVVDELTQVSVFATREQTAMLE